MWKDLQIEKNLNL